MQISKLRGNEIHFDESINKWRFSLDNEIVTTQYDTKHPCGNCGKHYTKDGHDGCLGTLIGVMNACCGHGNINECYIQFLDGECVRGKDAKVILNILKKHRKE
jgi:hypothetical protein